MAMFSISFFVRPDIAPVEKRVVDTDDLVDAVKKAKQLVKNSNLAESSEFIFEGFVVFDANSREVFNSFRQA